MLDVAWLVVLCVTLAFAAVAGSQQHGAQLLAPLLDHRLTRGRADTLSVLRRPIRAGELGVLGLCAVILIGFPPVVPRLLEGLAPLVGGLVVAVVLADSCLRLRTHVRQRRALAYLGAAAAAAVLVALGMLGALLAEGLTSEGAPARVSGGPAASLFVTLCALSCLALGAAHAATWLTWRHAGVVVDRARRAGARLIVVAAGLVVAATALAAGPGALSASLRRPVLGTAVVVILVALVGSLLFSRARRPEWAVRGTGVAVTVPALAVVGAQYPYLLVYPGDPSYSLRVADAARPAGLAYLGGVAGGAALAILLWRLWPWLPYLPGAARRAALTMCGRLRERRRDARLAALVRDAVSVAERSAKLDATARRALSERVVNHLGRRGRPGPDTRDSATAPKPTHKTNGPGPV